MKRSTVLKTAAGAGVLFILGAGVAYADTDATNQTTATITIAAHRTLTLSASTGSNFTVGATMARDSTGTALTNSGGASYTLAYITDYSGLKTEAGGVTDCAVGDLPTCTMDRVTVRATDDAVPQLVSNKVTLYVSPGPVTVESGNTPTMTTATITAAATKYNLAAGLSGLVTEAEGHFLLNFSADAGYATNDGSHSITLTYAIGATPNAS